MLSEQFCRTRKVQICSVTDWCLNFEEFWVFTHIFSYLVVESVPEKLEGVLFLRGIFKDPYDFQALCLSLEMGTCGAMIMVC